MIKIGEEIDSEAPLKRPLKLQEELAKKRTQE